MLGGVIIVVVSQLVMVDSSEFGKFCVYMFIYFIVFEWVFFNVVVDYFIFFDQYGVGVFEIGVFEFIDCQMEIFYGVGKLWYM